MIYAYVDDLFFVLAIAATQLLYAIPQRSTCKHANFCSCIFNGMAAGTATHAWARGQGGAMAQSEPEARQPDRGVAGRMHSMLVFMLSLADGSLLFLLFLMHIFIIVTFLAVWLLKKEKEYIYVYSCCFL